MDQDENLTALNRRDFVKKAGLISAGLMTALAGTRRSNAQETTTAAGLSPPPPETKPIPMRKFGKYDDQVSIIGLGGFHLGMPGEQTAIKIVHEAIDNGINFMDNCWDYNAGVSEERLGKALVSDGRRNRVFLMTKVCTHGRDAKVAMQQLEESLKRLQTDHLDLWQIHEVVYANDPTSHFSPGGTVEALLKAREQGKVRYIGFTGHKSPELHKEMLAHNFQFDSVQMPLNPFDANFRSFQHEILPMLNERKIAALGMKSLGGTGDMIKQKVLTIEEALRYAMSLPVTVTISGMPSLDVLHQNLNIARGFVPMTKAEMAAVEHKCAAAAGDGRFELYKVTAKFEGVEGRKVHGFPTQEQAPA